MTGNPQSLHINGGAKTEWKIHARKAVTEAITVQLQVRLTNPEEEETQEGIGRKIKVKRLHLPHWLNLVNQSQNLNQNQSLKKRYHNQ